MAQGPQFVDLYSTNLFFSHIFTDTRKYAHCMLAHLTHVGMLINCPPNTQ